MESKARALEPRFRGLAAAESARSNSAMDCHRCATSSSRHRPTMASNLRDAMRCRDPNRAPVNISQRTQPNDIDIRPRIHPFPNTLLRRHIRRSARHHVAARHGFILRGPSKPEIENLHPRFRNHNVARFQIAVHDALGVSLRQRTRDLRSIQQRRRYRQRTALQDLRDGFPFDQFHHQIIRPDVVKRADVRMIQRRNGASLPFKPGAKLFAGSLQRHRAPQPRIDSPKDFPIPLPPTCFRSGTARRPGLPRA